MTFSEGWRDQYERMLRSHQKLVEAARSSSLGSDEARDRLYHFFQDAYHLKDWVKNDDSDPTVLTPTIRNTVESIFDKVTGIPTLQRAADLCNGVKHLKLTTAKTGDKATAFTNQSVSIQMGAWGSGTPATAKHQWHITSGGQKYDAIDLADEVVDEWKTWLNAQKLL